MQILSRRGFIAGAAATIPAVALPVTDQSQVRAQFERVFAAHSLTVLRLH